jgi:hypothetical protein
VVKLRVARWQPQPAAAASRRPPRRGPRDYLGLVRAQLCACCMNGGISVGCGGKGVEEGWRGHRRESCRKEGRPTPLGRQSGIVLVRRGTLPCAACWPRHGTPRPTGMLASAVVPLVGAGEGVLAVARDWHFTAFSCPKCGTGNVGT